MNYFFILLFFITSTSHLYSAINEKPEKKETTPTLRPLPTPPPKKAESVSPKKISDAHQKLLASLTLKSSPEDFAKVWEKLTEDEAVLYLQQTSIIEKFALYAGKISEARSEIEEMHKKTAKSSRKFGGRWSSSIKPDDDSNSYNEDPEKEADCYRNHFTLEDKNKKKMPPYAICEPYDDMIKLIESLKTEGKKLKPSVKHFTDQAKRKSMLDRLFVGQIDPETATLIKEKGAEKAIQQLRDKLDETTQTYKAQLDENDRLHAKRFRNVFAYGFATGTVAVGSIWAAVTAFTWWQAHKSKA